MTDETMLPCPAPDCDSEFPSEEARRGHWGGSQDEQHTGKYYQAVEAYEDAQTQAQAHTPEPEGGGGLGVERVEEPDTEETEATEDTVSDTLDCPYCGADTNETEAKLAGGTWQCTECGGRFEVTE